jgi:hypothetical protein
VGLRLGAIDRIGSPPHQLVDRVVADTVHPSDAPERWFYELEAWLPQGILVGRLPEGIGGYGPFIDEGYRSFTALLDRGTGAATPITVGSLCPLSQYSHDGTWTCFRSAAQQPGRVAVELHRPGAAVQSWPSPGRPSPVLASGTPGVGASPSPPCRTTSVAAATGRQTPPCTS